MLLCSDEMLLCNVVFLLQLLFFSHTSCYFTYYEKPNVQNTFENMLYWLVNLYFYFVFYQCQYHPCWQVDQSHVFNVFMTVSSGHASTLKIQQQEALVFPFPLFAAVCLPRKLLFVVPIGGSERSVCLGHWPCPTNRG